MKIFLRSHRFCKSINFERTFQKQHIRNPYIMSTSFLQKLKFRKNYEFVNLSKIEAS